MSKDLGDYINERRYLFWESNFRFLEGKILTILDASMPDSNQKKALKDLLKQAIWTWAEEKSTCPKCNNGGLAPTLKLTDKNQYYCDICNMYYDKE